MLPTKNYNANEMFFDFDEVMTYQHSPAERHVIPIPEKSAGKTTNVVLYNSLTYDRTG